MNPGHNIQRLLLSCSAGIVLYILSSCSPVKNISRSAKQLLLEDSAIATGHIGISIYEPATGKYWYNHNADKNFIPASNTKLFTLYAGMKYLGDSLAGLKYLETDTSVIIWGTGDPTFLLPEFKNQPVLRFLQQARKPLVWGDRTRSFQALGNGWAWNDYEEPYMAERSVFPMHGNVVSFSMKDTVLVSEPAWFTKKGSLSHTGKSFGITRHLGDRQFYVTASASPFTSQSITFDTRDIFSLLADTLSRPVDTKKNYLLSPSFKNTGIIRSQPSDSFFTPMMHRSDNLFAEQTLLMVSGEILGYMNDALVIDTLLKSDLKDVPQKPRWVDGSGLSRYNLFTPLSFVYILNKLKNTFGMERLKVILATGGTGTLSNYYKKDNGYIFAKTGTLSNNCALSGFLFTKKGKLLVFSVLANNYQSGATPVRRAVERFLQDMREQY